MTFSFAYLLIGTLLTEPLRDHYISVPEFLQVDCIYHQEDAVDLTGDVLSDIGER